MTTLNNLFSMLSRQPEAPHTGMFGFVGNFSTRHDDSIRARSVALLQKLANTDELATPNQGAELRCLASRDY